MEDNTFYPTLTERGEEEAQRLINWFKDHSKKVLTDLLDEYLGNVYCDIACEIQSDSWQNYRNHIMEGYRDYSNNKKREYDFKDIRQTIYKENKEEIIKDLNQDLLKEIDGLKKTIALMENARRYNY